MEPKKDWTTVVFSFFVPLKPHFVLSDEGKYLFVSSAFSVFDISCRVLIDFSNEFIDLSYVIAMGFMYGISHCAANHTSRRLQNN